MLLVGQLLPLIVLYEFDPVSSVCIFNKGTANINENAAKPTGVINLTPIIMLINTAIIQYFQNCC
jgi:hypothetical protein